VNAAAKAMLGLEILAAYVRVRWLLRRRSLPVALQTLRSSAPSTTAGRDAHVAGLRLGRAVTRTLTALPTDSRCLTQALVLTSVLARRGIASSVVIGVHQDGAFRAHAWVEHHGRALLPTGGTAADGTTYQRLTEV
jgi:transglutaminase superfamily protein